MCHQPVCANTNVVLVTEKASIAGRTTWYVEHLGWPLRDFRGKLIIWYPEVLFTLWLKRNKSTQRIFPTIPTFRCFPYHFSSIVNIRLLTQMSCYIFMSSSWFERIKWTKLEHIKNNTFWRSITARCSFALAGRWIDGEVYFCGCGFIAQESSWDLRG